MVENNLAKIMCTGCRSTKTISLVSERYAGDKVNTYYLKNITGISINKLINGQHDLSRIKSISVNQNTTFPSRRPLQIFGIRK